MKKINIKDIGNSFVAGVKYRLEDFTLLKATQIFITIIMLCNLIFGDIYNDALLKLENAICGFYMFFFVLMGIVAWVFTLRIQQGKKLNVIVVLCSIIVALAFGGILISIMLSALATQASMTAASAVVVNKGLYFAYAMMAGYLITFIAVCLLGFRKAKAAY